MSAPVVAKRRGRGRWLILLVILALVAGGALYTVSGGRGGSVAQAAISVVDTNVDARKDATEFAPAIDGDVLATGDEVRADAKGRGFLTFIDGSTVTLAPSARVVVTEASRGGDGSTIVRLEQTAGLLWASVTKQVYANSRFEIHTPALTAVVRGTGFESEVASNGATTIRVADGTVVESAQGVDQLVSAGSQSTTAPGAAPGVPTPLPPTAGLHLAANAGVRITVYAPDHVACGAGRLDAPFCTTGSVDLGRIAAGAFNIVLGCDPCGPFGLDIGARFGTSAAGALHVDGTIAAGDLLLATLPITLDAAGHPVLGAMTPFHKITSSCEAEARGPVLGAAGTPPAPGDTATAIVTDALIQANLDQALSSLGNLPVQISQPTAGVTLRGIRLSGRVGFGPLDVGANIVVVADAHDGKLTPHVSEIELGPIPAEVTTQFKQRLEEQLAQLGSGVPLAVDRVISRDGCLALIGRLK